jgi:hypothetical protein
VKAVPVDVQVNYVAGGGAANLPVRVSAMVRARYLQLPDFSEFNFQAPRATRKTSRPGRRRAGGHGHTRDCRQAAPHAGQKRRRQSQYRQSARRRYPQDLLLEASYADPNGEVQTLRSTRPCGLQR